MADKHDHLVALFDTEDHANAAVKNLNTAGYNDVSVVTAKSVGDDAVVKEPGFWKKLFGKAVEEYEAKVYAHNVAKGGAVVAVHAAPQHLAEAGGLLAAHNAVDLKKRVVDDAILTPKAANTITETVVAAPKVPVVEELNKDAVLKLAKESIEVGKKVVEAGTTRLRRYVVETPVEKSISLHEEHVEVWEKAINEPATLRDVDWDEATIEARETAEVPFASKSVRYVGEVGLREVGTDHLATYHDVVREEKVDVEEVDAGIDVALPEGWTEEV
jgi:hypothetical protein